MPSHPTDERALDTALGLRRSRSGDGHDDGGSAHQSGGGNLSCEHGATPGLLLSWKTAPLGIRSGHCSFIIQVHAWWRNMALALVKKIASRDVE
jgi:hypothetical protein